MPHDMPLVMTVAAGLTAALVFGLLTHRLGMSPIVGYLLAGIAVGPHTPGYLADVDIAMQLSEIGVALLMFGVGMHFHPKDLLAVKSTAIPGAIAQSAAATLLGIGLSLTQGWGLPSGVILGTGLSVASTVVLIRGLEATGQLHTPAGRLSIGWLIVEDIFTVIALVMLPAVTAVVAGPGTMDRSAAWSVALSLAKALGMVAVLAALVLWAGGKLVPRLLAQVARTRSRELFTLTVLAVGLGVAVLSALAFGASMALGAFLAGIVVGQSRVSHQAAADALPLRDAFAVLFFVAVGMLFDPAFLLDQPAFVGGALAIILVGKPLVAILIVLVLGGSVHAALMVAVGLAQIGEFSFILATAALALNEHLGRPLYHQDVLSVLIAAAILSITLNPLLFRTVPAVELWLRRRHRLWTFLHRRSEARGRAANDLTQQALASPEVWIGAIIVGYGPVGQTVLRILHDFRIEPVVIDLNLDTVLKLGEEGVRALYGDASHPDLLRAAGLEHARYLIVTLPDLMSRIPVVINAREINPNIRVIVRARYISEMAMLEEIGADIVAFEEVESAVALAEVLLREVGADQERIDAARDEIRDEHAVGRFLSGE